MNYGENSPNLYIPIVSVLLIVTAIGIVSYGESQKPKNPPCKVEVFSQNGELFETFTLSESENPIRYRTCVEIAGREYPPTWHVKLTPIQEVENEKE